MFNFSTYLFSVILKRAKTALMGSWSSRTPEILASPLPLFAVLPTRTVLELATPAPLCLWGSSEVFCAIHPFLDRRGANGALRRRELCIRPPARPGDPLYVAGERQIQDTWVGWILLSSPLSVLLYLACFRFMMVVYFVNYLGMLICRIRLLIQI